MFLLPQEISRILYLSPSVTSYAHHPIGLAVIFCRCFPSSQCLLLRANYTKVDERAHLALPWSVWSAVSRQNCPLQKMLFRFADIFLHHNAPLSKRRGTRTCWAASVFSGRKHWWLQPRTDLPKFAARVRRPFPRPYCFKYGPKQRALN